MDPDYKVTKFEAIWDNAALGSNRKGLDVTWSEKENAVKYQTKKFKLQASVEVSMSSSLDDWAMYEIGFIQACTSNFQCNYYTSGAQQRWEFDGIPLNPNGSMKGAVNDSDADDHIPWYNVDHARKMFTVPTLPEIINIDMDDDFNPTITWTESGVPTSYLFRIYRSQYFYNWLVSRKVQSSNYKVLGFVGWTIPVDIKFNRDASNKPIHSSWVDQSPESEIWLPSSEHRPALYPEALRKPRANAAQAIYRYPADGSPKQKL